MDSSQMEALEEMLVDTKSEVLLKKSFLIFKINKENMVSRIAIGILSITLAFLISLFDTIVIMNEVIVAILDTALAIFGIVFTGYAFFQALLNGQLISVLIEDVNRNEKMEQRNTLDKTNWNFIQLMIQFLVVIFTTLVLKIILLCIPTDFCVFRQMRWNVIVSTLLIFSYFYYLSVIMWRMISFIFNIYQLFTSYAVTKYISFVKHGKDE